MRRRRWRQSGRGELLARALRGDRPDEQSFDRKALRTLCRTFQREPDCSLSTAEELMCKSGRSPGESSSQCWTSLGKIHHPPPHARLNFTALTLGNLFHARHTPFNAGTESTTAPLAWVAPCEGWNYCEDARGRRRRKSRYGIDLASRWQRADYCARNAKGWKSPREPQYISNILSPPK